MAFEDNALVMNIKSWEETTFSTFSILFFLLRGFLTRHDNW
jgi:hypothetical protein